MPSFCFRCAYSATDGVCPKYADLGKIPCQETKPCGFAGFPDEFFAGKAILELGCGLGIVGQVSEFSTVVAFRTMLFATMYWH